MVNLPVQACTGIYVERRAEAHQKNACPGPGELTRRRRRTHQLVNSVDVYFLCAFSCLGSRDTECVMLFKVWAIVVNGS